jgi:hypothetical protein
MGSGEVCSALFTPSAAGSRATMDPSEEAAMRDPVQILLVLDLASDNPIPLDQVTGLLPDKRKQRVTLKLSDFGAVPGPRGSVVDWEACADAVVRMIDQALTIHPEDGQPVDFYVVGRAALPIFAHLGALLSKWSTVTILNQRQDGTWDNLPLKVAAATGGDKVFTLHGLGDPTDATGRVAVFVSTAYAAPRDAIKAFLSSRGEPLAGIVEIVTASKGVTLLDAANAASVLHELTDAFAEIRRVYPSTTSIALFIGGPASLAFIAGRAVNPNVFSDIWVPNYVAPSYHFALALPWKGRAPAEVNRDAEHELARLKALGPMLAEIELLRKTLTIKHLPPFLSQAVKTQFLEWLKKIQIAPQPEGDAFSLSVGERTMAFGRGLLDALLRVSAEHRNRIAQSIFLHEVFHFHQNIQSSTYAGIGRAGFALEEVDYWADVVALGTLVTWEISRNGARGKEEARSILVAHLGAALAGIEAFDRAEQGDRLERLAERRLRRYLIWHLQYARAKTLKSADQIWDMFGERLIVELAPLDSFLDARGDKVVRSANQATELFVVLRSRLIRMQRGASLDPGKLIDAVRAFDSASLEQVMVVVRDQNHEVLAPE